MRPRVAVLLLLPLLSGSDAGGEDEPAADPPAPLSSLAKFLERPDWLSRALAAKELGRRSEDGVIAAVCGRLLVETEPRVVAVLLRALRGRAREDVLAETTPELVDRLIPLARDENPRVAESALEVLARLPPAPVEGGLEGYVSWWIRNRKAYRTSSEAALARRAASRPAPVPPKPGETVTVPTADLRRYGLLDRIHREGLEVVICIDSTGSMAEEIAEAKATVEALVRRMRLLAPRFRVGLVSYDDEARLLLPLSSEERALGEELEDVFALGGGDTEEGVDRAVFLALRQERVGWSARAARSIVIVGDAPPHDEDVPRLYGALRRAREDEAYELPVRVDTISAGGGEIVDPDGFVRHFREIARRGGGTAVRLSAARSLARSIVASAFGPAWHDTVLELLSDLDAFEAAAEKASKKGQGR
jgi:Mg-chelatase subunit ChlD